MPERSEGKIDLEIKKDHKLKVSLRYEDGSKSKSVLLKREDAAAMLNFLKCEL